MKSHEILVKRGREIVQAAPQAYIDLDVESDGDAGYGSLLSIGAVSPWNCQPLTFPDTNSLSPNGDASSFLSLAA